MKLVKILLGLVVLLVVAVFVVGLFADNLAQTAIEEGGTYALGVDTKVAGVDVGILSETFSMDGFTIANPAGHGDGSFLELDSGSVAVSATSLLSDKIEVPSIDLSGFRVQLVQGAKGSNYGTILDNLKRFQTDGAPSGGAAEPSDGAASEGKRFVVRKLTMTDLEVNVVPVPELNLGAVKVPIDKIELKDIGTESDKGVLLSDLVGIVVESILKRASASGQLPNLVQGALSGQLGQLQGLADAGVQALEGLVPGGGGKGGLDAAKDALGEGLKGLGIGR